MGKKVQAQKAALRWVAFTAKPCTLLNHWRSLSTSDIMAIGSRKMEHSCKQSMLVCKAVDKVMAVDSKQTTHKLQGSNAGALAADETGHCSSSAQLAMTGSARLCSLPLLAGLGAPAAGCLARLPHS